MKEKCASDVHSKFSKNTSHAKNLNVFLTLQGTFLSVEYRANIHFDQENMLIFYLPQLITCSHYVIYEVLFFLSKPCNLALGS